jgi:2-phospho-L-lactate guanylyltransferase
MTVWAVIPVKPLNRAKSRLEKVLTPEQRYELAQMMLRQILSVTSQTPGITGTLIISRDTRAIGIARDFGARTVQESGFSDLNPALERATGVMRAWRAGAILILPADLPFIAAEDITEMVELGQDLSTVVIATDRHRDGTNAMLVRPPGLMTYAYGTGSFDRHVTIAHEAQARVQHYESERTMLDIDEPDDLALYNDLVEAGTFEHLKPFLTTTT